MRSHLTKQIEKKQAEIQRLEDDVREAETKLREARAYVQALNDVLKTIPKEEKDANATTLPAAVRELRHGSDVAKARDALLKAGAPLHISELLPAIGKPVNKQSRVSLSGSLGAYARDQIIFTRTAPNTFGLIEFQNTGSREELEERIM